MIFFNKLLPDHRCTKSLTLLDLYFETNLIYMANIFFTLLLFLSMF
jgi:hypothetical protein